ncbi:MAG: maleylpyruvate isomerase family mycothiol-dependent enzyme [Acidimicrobiales bacterium]
MSATGHLDRSDEAGALALSRTLEEIQAVSSEIAEMLRRLSDASKATPHSDWSIYQHAAHLAVAQQGFADWISGAEPENLASGARRGFAAAGGRFDQFSQVNAGVLRDFGQRSPAQLAGLIAAGTRAVLAASGSRDPRHRAPSPFGPLGPGTYLAYVLTHLLAHGHPIARALGRPTPITRSRVLLCLPFLEAVLPLAFDNQERGRKIGARLEVRLRGGERFTVCFDEGALSVEPAPAGRVHCYLFADPVAFFLVWMGLRSQWGLIASGRLVAFGRRPWLALRLKSLAPNP